MFIFICTISLLFTSNFSNGSELAEARSRSSSLSDNRYDTSSPKDMSFLALNFERLRSGSMVQFSDKTGAFSLPADDFKETLRGSPKLLKEMLDGPKSK